MASPNSSTTLQSTSAHPTPKAGKGASFWLSFLALVVCLLLGALDLTAVSTALPTITADLNGGDEFVWVGSAYALSSTAILPLSGGLADIFGRKPIMLLSITFFAAGSAIAGAAQNMHMLIAARTIQGIGGGCILNLSEIIVSDLVPLAERGLYQGIIGLTWSFASGVGPPIGGSLAEKASWRWLFYINLPLTGVAFILTIIFLDVRTPAGSMRGKLGRVDWGGNFIVIAGTTLAVVALTFAGGRFAWDSAQVLAPLIIGIALVFLFLWYEAKVPTEPTIPWDILTNRTSLSAYASTFFHGIASISIIYYLPIFFQACRGTSPIRAGVDMLPTALIISPFALLAGALVQITRKYRPSTYMGWILTIVGFGVLSLLRADNTVGQWVGYQVLVAAGIGMNFSATVFPVLAPLPVERTASALAFFAFVRSFAQTWGITISSTILQNELKKNLPGDFIRQFPEDMEIAYAAIPVIQTLEEPLRSQVQQSFSVSMAVIWKTMIGIAGAGILTLPFLKEVELKTHTDESFGLSEGGRARPVDEETIVVPEVKDIGSQGKGIDQA
ncbi:iron permease [Panus rudis PR-1116 ss-1]|nr:iron permease [Panus rudis PR-1116 ss-1]